MFLRGLPKFDGPFEPTSQEGEEPFHQVAGGHRQGSDLMSLKLKAQQDSKAGPTPPDAGEMVESLVFHHASAPPC